MSLTNHPQWVWPDAPIDVIHAEHGPGLLTTRGAFYGYGPAQPYEPAARPACEPDYSRPSVRAAVLAANGPKVDPTRARWLPGLVGFEALILSHLDQRQQEAGVTVPTAAALAAVHGRLIGEMEDVHKLADCFFPGIMTLGLAAVSESGAFRKAVLAQHPRVADFCKGSAHLSLDALMTQHEQAVLVLGPTLTFARPVRP